MGMKMKRIFPSDSKKYTFGFVNINRSDKIRGLFTINIAPNTLFPPLFLNSSIITRTLYKKTIPFTQIRKPPPPQNVILLQASVSLTVLSAAAYGIKKFK